MTTNSHNPSQLAYLISAEIEARGLSLRQFARLVDIDPGTISRILSGQRLKIQSITLEKLASVTELSVQTLRNAMHSLIAEPTETVEETSLEGMSLLYSEGSIDRCVSDLARDISLYYQDRPFVIVCVLSSAWIFVADLVRKIASTNLEVDFVRTARDTPDDAEDVTLLWDIRADITDKEVLVVDDMSDTGATLECVTNHLWKKQPKDVRTCTLLHRVDPHTKHDNLIDFSGLKATTRFVIGYGMDDELSSQQNYRNLPRILRMDSPNLTDQNSDVLSEYLQDC